MMSEKEILEYLHKQHQTSDLETLRFEITRAINMLTANHRPKEGYSWTAEGDGFEWKVIITLKRKGVE